MKTGPQGIYYLPTVSTSAKPDNPNNWAIFGGTPVSNHLNGAVGRISWEELEPSEGNYNWTYLDALQKQSADWNYLWEISVMCGADFPAWVPAAGAQTVTLHDNGGNPVTICVPWDSVFQAKWGALIAKVGSRYDSDPNLQLVQMQGVGRQGECFFCSNTVTADYAWLQANGGAAAWIGAAEAIAGFYLAALPTTYVCYSTGSPLPTGVDPNNLTMGSVVASLYSSNGIGAAAQFAVRDSGYSLNGKVPIWNLKNQGAQQTTKAGTGAAAEANQAYQQPYSYRWFEVTHDDCMIQSNWPAFDNFNNGSK